MSQQPTLAVWKFASCDGCQLTLLDCEDELLTIAEQVRSPLSPRRRARWSADPTTCRWSRAPITTPHDERRIQRDPGAVRGAGDHRRVRHGGRHPGAAQLRRHRRIRLGRLRQARIHRHAGHVDTGVGARSGRLRAAGLPHRPRAAARHPGRPADRAQAAAAGQDGVHRVQTPRGHVCRCRRGHPVPRPGHPRRLRRAVPAPSTAAATGASGRPRHRTRRR